MSVLLGCAALRTGQHLKWDGPAMRFTNSSDANRLLEPQYRNGWSFGWGRRVSRMGGLSS